MRQVPNAPHVPATQAGKAAFPSRAVAVSWGGLAIRVASAVIWILAGVSKLPDLSGFAAQVDLYQLLPHAVGAILAYIFPFFEIFLGLYLGAGLFVRASALVGTAVFVVLLATQIQALIRGLDLDCGCFGTLSRAAIGPWKLFRDMALGLPTFVMLAVPARRFSLDRRLFGAPDRFFFNS